MKTTWKDIPGYEGKYQVSDTGCVKRIPCVITYKNGHVSNYKEKTLNPEITKGYKRVTLSSSNIQKRFQVHRLVTVVFIPNPDNKPCVNHIDGDKINNNACNLEWCTYSENERHSYDVLNKISKRRKLTDRDADYIRDSSKNGPELAKMFNVDKTTIYNIKNNKYYV